MTTRPSDDDLKWLATVAVQYEFSQLIQCNALLPAVRGNLVLEPFFWNMTLESFVAHARNLIDFFYIDALIAPKTPKHSDVYAGLYTDMWDRPPISDLLWRARHRANKQLAHITVDRKEMQSESWDHNAITKELMVLWQGFLNALSPQRRVWFESGDRE